MKKGEGNMLDERLKQVIKSVVAEILEVDVEDIGDEVSLIDELDAESLDILDALYKVSKLEDKKVTMQMIYEDFRGGLTMDEFIDSAGYITEEGVEKMKISLGRTDLKAGEIMAKDLYSYITINYMTKVFQNVM